jgi:hypothetical protein
VLSLLVTSHHRPLVERLASTSVLLCSISLWLFLASTSAAQESYLVKLEGEGLITLDATNVPLGTLLQALSRRVPLEIRGGVAPDERVSVQFSRLSLKEALGKMIRNYNYVLVMPEGNEKPVLTIINPITRAPSREEPPPAVVTKGGAAPTQPKGTPPAPGPIPGQAPGIAPGIQDVIPPDADPNRPTVRERRDVPRTAPPGMPPPGPALPGISPGSRPQPRPQTATETPAKKETQTPVQEPTPATAPETVMTPFGFRSVTPPETDRAAGTGNVQVPVGAPGTVPSPIPIPQDRSVP